MSSEKMGSPAPFKIGLGKTGVLLIHGFTGSPAEMRGLGEYLGARDYMVHGLLVPGHGTQATDLALYKWQQWVSACGRALDELRRSTEQVFVVGLSNGGLLSLYLAATVRPRVDGVVVMSPPIISRDWRMTAAPLLKYVVRWHTKGEPANIDPAMQERLWHYKRFPTAPLTQMLALAREDRRLLPSLSVPLLVMQGRHDKTVEPDCADYVYKRAGSSDKDMVYWPNSGHIITEDSDRYQVWERIERFIKAHERIESRDLVGARNA